MLKASVPEARLNGDGPLGLASSSAGGRKFGRRMSAFPAGAMAGESKLGVVEGPTRAWWKIAVVEFLSGGAHADWSPSRRRFDFAEDVVCQATYPLSRYVRACSRNTPIGHAVKLKATTQTRRAAAYLNHRMHGSGGGQPI
jgi:hypothetical protein